MYSIIYKVYKRGEYLLYIQSIQKGDIFIYKVYKRGGIFIYIQSIQKGYIYYIQRGCYIYYIYKGGDIPKNKNYL